MIRLLSKHSLVRQTAKLYFVSWYLRARYSPVLPKRNIQSARVLYSHSEHNMKFFPFFINPTFQIIRRHFYVQKLLGHEIFVSSNSKLQNSLHFSTLSLATCARSTIGRNASNKLSRRYLHKFDAGARTIWQRILKPKDFSFVRLRQSRRSMLSRGRKSSGVNSGRSMIRNKARTDLIQFNETISNQN